MFANTSKSVRYLAVATCLAGLNGCASDGGIGDLATLAAVGGSMMPSMDTGTIATLGAVAVASQVVIPLATDDPTKDWSSTTPESTVAIPTTSGASAAAPATAATLIAAEVPEAYRNESCDYLEVAVVFAYERLEGRKKANDIEGQQIAQSRIAARSKALSEKKCPPSTWVGGRIGISMDNIDPRYVAMYKIPAEGAIVLFVAPKGAADKAGVKVGDVVTAVNDKPIRNAIDLRTVLGHSPIGSVQNLRIRRDTTFMVATPQIEGPATPLPPIAAL